MLKKSYILKAIFRIDRLWCKVTVQYSSGTIRVYRHRNNSAATCNRPWFPKTVLKFMRAPNTIIEYTEGKSCNSKVSIVEWRSWTYSLPVFIDFDSAPL